MSKEFFTKCEIVSYNKFTNVIRFKYKDNIVQTVCKFKPQNPYYIYASVKYNEDGTIHVILRK